MTSLTALPDSFSATRDTLQRVAVHIVARARWQGGAHSVGLRVTPGGFGTPEFGDELTRVRVSGDLLVRDGFVPEDLKVGDIISTPVTGAYGYSLGSNYNKVLRPPVVFVRDGDARLVVRRETFDDLTRLDV